MIASELVTAELVKAVRYETKRLTTVRSTLWMVIGLIIIQFFGAWISLGFDPVSVASNGASSLLSAVLFASFSASSTASEYSSGTAKLTYLLFPKRWSTALVRPLVLAAASMVASVFCLLGVVGYVLATGASGIDREERLVGLVLFHGLASLLGSGAGLVLRRPVPTIAGLICWILLVENVVSTTRWSSKWLRPVGSGMALSGVSVEFTSGPGRPSNLEDVGAVEGGLILLAVALGLLLVGSVRHRLSDLT